MALEKQHVLSKQEKAVMRAVFNAKDKNADSCTLTSIQILKNIPLDLAIQQDELYDVLRQLEIDEYFKMTKEDQDGNEVYSFQFLSKGMRFAREEKSFKSNIIFRLSLAVGTGIVGALVGWAIKAILTKVSGG